MSSDYELEEGPSRQSLAEDPDPYRSSRSRVRIFIDHSNLELTMRGQARQRGVAWSNFDWQKLPQWLVAQTQQVCSLDYASYEGAHVYASHDPDDTGHDGFRKFASFLGFQPGVQVVLKELRRKDPPVCRTCKRPMAICPECNTPHRPRVEKGVDTAMVTDMIRLAWQDAYDIAVLVSSDSDFAPVVDLLDQRGLKVVQAGFPPVGAYLRTRCWASFDIFEGRAEVERRQ